MAELTQKNEFEINGKVLFVGQPKPIGTKGHQKRILVMEAWVDNKFKQELAFDFFGEKMALCNNVREDDWVTVYFNLRGNKTIEKNGLARWFINLGAYHLNIVKKKGE